MPESFNTNAFAAGVSNSAGGMSKEAVWGLVAVAVLFGIYLVWKLIKKRKP